MTLRDMMARHARTTMVRADHFGESVTFHGRLGDVVTFLAVVDRKQLETMGNSAVRAADVFIPRHATAGVEQIVDGDELEVALVEGGTPVRCRIAEVLSADPGGFLVRVTP